MVYRRIHRFEEPRVTKRLSSSARSGNTHGQTEEEEMGGDNLRLTFT